MLNYFLLQGLQLSRPHDQLPQHDLYKSTLHGADDKRIPLLVSEIKWHQCGNKAVYNFFTFANRTSAPPASSAIQSRTGSGMGGCTCGRQMQLRAKTVQICFQLHACHNCLSLVHKHCVMPFSKSLNFSHWPSSIHTPATLRFTVTAAQRSALEA